MNYGFKNLRRGFTLIELMISMAVFVIFLTMVSSSYIGIVRAQRQANDVRKIYSELRNMIQMLNQEIRLGSLYYDCYSSTVAVSNANSLCADVQGQIQPDGHLNNLYLIKKDGAEAILFSYDPEDKTLKEKKWLRTKEGNFQPVLDSKGLDTVKLMSDSVELSNFSFVISPTVNPYSSFSEIYSNSATQFQPKVTVLFTAKSKNQNMFFNFDFQTTISSRVYSRTI